jgi:hypothetical protein
VDADGKRDLLASAAALLNPISWREPFGMAMLESLACGTPVVGCPRGAAPEIVEHGVTGFLGDSDAEMINGLLSLDQIDRAVCREQARERFSVARMVDGYVQLFEQRRRQRLPACRRCGIQLFLGDTATLGRCVEKGVDLGRSWHGGSSLRQQIGLGGVGQ